MSRMSTTALRLCTYIKPHTYNLRHVYNNDTNNDASVNLLNNMEEEETSSSQQEPQIQHTNEVIDEMQQKLDKANNIAASYINANNMLKTQNSQLKIRVEDLETDNEEMRQKVAEMSNQLETADVKNLKRVQDKLKAVEYENMRLPGAVMFRLLEVRQEP